MKKSLMQMFALVVVLVFCVSALSACSGKNVNVTEDGTPVLATDEVAAEDVVTVNGQVITISDLQYYIYNSAMMQLYQMDPEFTGDVSGVDWEEKMENGDTLEEAILEDAIDSAIGDLVTAQTGEENGVALSDDEKAMMAETMDSFVEQFGEEVFQLNLQAMGLESKEAYQKMYERVSLVQMVQEDVQSDMSKYIDNVEELKKHKSEDKVTVQHVLILSADSKHENPEEVAKEVLDKAKAGEDFAQLIEQYNEDPGATAAGYTFGPGEMVAEFEEASFALDYDEISDIVETEYGYHIIKRLVGSAELQNYWVSKAEIKENKSAKRQISVVDIINAINNAQMELQAQSAAAEEAAAETAGEADAAAAEGESNNG